MNLLLGDFDLDGPAMVLERWRLGLQLGVEDGEKFSMNTDPAAAFAAFRERLLSREQC